MNTVSPATDRGLASPASSLDPVCGMTVQANKAAQLSGIDEMRNINILCERLQISDCQPLRGLKGVPSGSRAERHGNAAD